VFWLVQLVECDDGSEPDERYADGVVIEDRRESAHDLVGAANERWGTRPLTGERYKLTPLYNCRTVSVTRSDEDGFEVAGNGS
jgi:hypothetical protein